MTGSRADQRRVALCVIEISDRLQVKHKPTDCGLFIYRPFMVIYCGAFMGVYHISCNMFTSYYIIYYVYIYITRLSLFLSLSLYLSLYSISLFISLFISLSLYLSLSPSPSGLPIYTHMNYIYNINVNNAGGGKKAGLQVP